MTNIAISMFNRLRFGLLTEYNQITITLVYYNYSVDYNHVVFLQVLVFYISSIYLFTAFSVEYF